MIQKNDPTKTSDDRLDMLVDHHQFFDVVAAQVLENIVDQFDRNVVDRHYCAHFWLKFLNKINKSWKISAPDKKKNLVVHHLAAVGEQGLGRWPDDRRRFFC